MVEKILPGGAIEAWNKQCPGEVREIPGDRIVMINGHEDSEAMRCDGKFFDAYRILSQYVSLCQKHLGTAAHSSYFEAMSALVQEKLRQRW